MKKKIIVYTKKDLFAVKTTSEYLNLLEIHLDEWKHRDTMMWKQVYTLFFSTLIVTIIPYIDLWGLKIEEYLPKIIFPILGFILTIAFTVVGNGYAYRLKASSNTYNKLLQKLPKEYARISLAEISNSRILRCNMSVFIIHCMTLALLFLEIIVFVITIK